MICSPLRFNNVLRVETTEICVLVLFPYRWLLPLGSVVLLAVLSGCGAKPAPPRQSLPTSGEVTIEGDVWADNWFSLYLGDQLLIEDSVSITTERSFNAESFSFQADYPIALNLIAKDFKQDDSGLEYIGSKKQQLGDGGLIAQFRDAKTGKPVALTNASWRCFVLHHGPVDEACAAETNPQAGVGPCEFTVAEAPEGWMDVDYDATAWEAATKFSEREVRPKDGYDRIQWHEDAALIWAADLKKDNTVLFRIVIDKPVE